MSSAQSGSTWPVSRQDPTTRNSCNTHEVRLGHKREEQVSYIEVPGILETTILTSPGEARGERQCTQTFTTLIYKVSLVRHFQIAKDIKLTEWNESQPGKNMSIHNVVGPQPFSKAHLYGCHGSSPGKRKG